jgi:type III restriction enzyme
VVLDDDKKVYLIRETKSTHDTDKRRLEEILTIICGKMHCKVLGDVDYRDAISAKEVVSLNPR